MKAVVYYAPGDIRVEQVEVPVCGDSEIRVKIDACAVCGTDLKAYVSGNPRIQAPSVRNPTHKYQGKATAKATATANIGRINQQVRKKCSGANGRTRLMARPSRLVGAPSRVGSRMINKNIPITAVGNTSPTGPLAKTVAPIAPQHPPRAASL